MGIGYGCVVVLHAIYAHRGSGIFSLAGSRVLREEREMAVSLCKFCQVYEHEGVEMYSGDNFVRDFIIGAAVLVCLLSVYCGCVLCLYRLLIGKQQYTVRVVSPPGCECINHQIERPVLFGENFQNIV